jgi:TolB-like protein/Tfp pilus assembly protein PilF
VDGAPLVSDSPEAEVTRALPESRPTGEAPTEALRNTGEGKLTTSALKPGPPSAAIGAPRRSISRRKLALIITLIVLIVVVAPIAILGIAGYIGYRHARDTEVAIDSIAVLPFENQTQNSDSDYLSDGVTESIINSLTQLPNLRVIARSSVFRYKGKQTDPFVVGKELGVRAVLVGRMMQRGDSITISTELVDVRDSKQLWGEQYSAKVSDLLSVQRQIASQITSNLRLKLSGAEEARVTKHYTENPEAYQLYLKGNYYASKYTKDGLRKGIDYFNQAIAADPNYALAYNGLAYYYISTVDWYLSPRESIPRARDAANKALAIDENLADAHTSLATVAYWYDWDSVTAEREYKRAIELNPKNSRSRDFYSWYLVSSGRVDQALAEAKDAVQLDPVSAEINSNLGQVLLLAHQYDRAIEQLRSSIELDPSYFLAHNYLGRAYEANGKLPEAIAEFQRTLQIEDGIPENWSNLGHAYALSGKTGEAQTIIERLKRLSASSYVPPYNMAVLYAGLGNKNEAFAWLNRAYDERSFYLPAWLRVDPQMDSLRSDARFADLVRRVGLRQ